MYCRQGKWACVISYMPSDMLIIALSCLVLLSSTPQCKAKDDSYTAYEREYHFDWGHGFQGGWREVVVNEKWGFINSAGEAVMKPKFNQVFGFHEGIVLC